jgi:CBS-domain-containing membrane protein
VPSARAPEPVRLDSPATDVMTDLHRVSAVTIEGYASIDDANQAMIAHGVRALFVVDDARQLLGIVTATDILGERPVQFAQERGIRHGEIVVRDIMTPAERLEILDIREVRRARVGDVVATLRVVGRQHALAVEAADGAPDGRKTVCGIFSLTQIARQLGIPPQPMHDMARTFAEIEAVIAS